MTTEQAQPVRSADLDEAINYLREAGALARIADLFEAAAIRIGQHGWWCGTRTKREGMACCIWLAVDTEMDVFFGELNELRGKAFTVASGLLVRQLKVRLLRDVFNLNDKQPEWEGQGWAIYHLRQISQNLRAEYGL